MAIFNRVATLKKEIEELNKSRELILKESSAEREEFKSLIKTLREGLEEQKKELEYKNQRIKTLENELKQYKENNISIYEEYIYGKKEDK